MNTFGKAAGIVVLLIAVVLIGSFAKTVVKSKFKEREQGKTDRAVEELLEDTAKNISRQLPIMVDPNTRLDMVICNGKQMHYKYTMINYSENKLDKEAFKNEATSTLSKNQCNNKKMVELLKMGVEYYYIYFDKNGNLITTIQISKKNCGLI